jgi:hypothetical protein
LGEKFPVKELESTELNTFLAQLIFDPGYGSDIPQKHQFMYELHSNITQNMEAFFTL